MSKSIPMTLERACALKEEMKKYDDLLFAVNNRRVFGKHGAWQVDANIKNSGEVIRIHCESEWEQFLKELE